MSAKYHNISSEIKQNSESDQNESYIAESTFVPRNTPHTAKPFTYDKNITDLNIENPAVKKSKLKTNNLKSKLYSNSSNCLALAAVQHRKEESDIPFNKPQPPHFSKPENNFTIRTHMFKKDFEKMKKRDVSNKLDYSTITTNMFRKQLRKLSDNHIEVNETVISPETELEQDKELSNNDLEEHKKTVCLTSDSLPKEVIQKSPKVNVINNRLCTPNREMLKDNKIKNIYDNQVPEEIDFHNQLLTFRQNLNWNSNLPRHGPGYRKKFDKLTDKVIIQHDENDENYDNLNSQNTISVKNTQLKQILDSKDDDGKFVYALERNRNDPRGRYLPYDLEVVSAHLARSSSYYWTGSASSVTLVRNGEQSERTPVLLWLLEKRLFYYIYNLRVFVHFRKWKAFQVWKSNIKRQHHFESRMTLTKVLFCSNEILQGCLLHIRNLCEDASNSVTGIGCSSSGIMLINLKKNITLSLSEFLKDQKVQTEKSFEQLKSLKNIIVELVFEACATVAENEGITKGIRPKILNNDEDFDEYDDLSNDEITDVKKKPIYQSKLEKKYNIGINENKPVGKIIDKKSDKKPSYALIVEWRKILRRLSYFLRAVDYQILELLRRLVLTSNRLLSEYLHQSYYYGQSKFDNANLSSQISLPNQDISFEENYTSHGNTTFYGEESSSIKIEKVSSPAVSIDKSSLSRKIITPVTFQDYEEKELTFSTQKNTDHIITDIKPGNNFENAKPIFIVQLVLIIPEPNENKSSVKAVDRKTVKFNTYDSEVDTNIEENQFSREQSANDLYAYPESSVNSDLEESIAHVTISPSDVEIKDGISLVMSCFEETVSKIGSLLKEERLAAFYSPADYDRTSQYEEEKRLEEEADIERPPWPDTELLFGSDPMYQKSLTKINDLIEKNLSSVLLHSEKFEKFTSMVEKARNINVEESMKKREWTTDDFNKMLTIHTEYEREMLEMERQRIIGLIKVENETFCQNCLPYPRKIISDVIAKLPGIASDRNEALLKIIRRALKTLDRTPLNVEEFVEYLSFTSKMSAEMNNLDREYNVVTKLYSISKDFEVPIDAEDFALYQILGPSFQHLKTTLLWAEAKKEDNIRKFTSELDGLISNVRQKIIGIKIRVQDPILLKEETPSKLVLEKIELMNEEVSELQSNTRNYMNYQERFGSSLPPTKKDEFALIDKNEENSTQDLQTDLSEIERDLMLRKLLWESLWEWDKLEAEWIVSTFDSLAVETLQKNVNRFTQTVFMLEKGLPNNNLVPKLKKKVMAFKQIMPIIVSLRNPSLKDRHWLQIEILLGKNIYQDKEFTLGHLIEMKILKYKDKIQDISTTASNEATLERMLQKVVDLWHATQFRLISHATANISIIAGAEDILSQLEESQMTIGTIRGSRYVGPIKNLVEDWERRLNLFSRTLDEWMTCQRNWLYLEQIFTTPDIQRQLPNEYKIFSAVDKSWKDIMRKTEDSPNALKSATSPGVLESLQTANTSLEKVQKCLEDYLETKRLVFPRFYFLSNDELLDILAQSKNPDAVQPHLGKCFGNIKELDIKIAPRQPATVKTMTSAEGEVMEMPKNLRARGPVEQWLCNVENGMFDSVKRHLKNGLLDWLGISHEEWVLKHPGQVVLTVAQIMFNKDVIQCFLSGNPLSELNKLKKKMVEYLNTLANLVSQNLIVYRRLTINALLTMDVHNRDILNDLINLNVKSIDDFEWTRQLRYEWDETKNNCNVRQSNAIFTYGYEYLGCSPRLVITPLTDRCYLTLTGALALNLGGSPAGPAGTGKTETVKDLAKAMGKQCVVFNCSEGLDFKMLGKFFSGLAQAGSWCCFDEFNRIDIEVLSVVAQQIHTIKTAKDLQTPRFIFDGREIKLTASCGIFITMNPTYAGRVELPDNLKSLFRPVAMMVPDYVLIAEIMLFSEGFTGAKSLSIKIVNLYQLASKQLSQQDHYDFGMRAIKSVLVYAGIKKRHAQLKHHKRKILNEEEEAHILIHSLRDANMPKFLAEDVPLFESIMADLFPGISAPMEDFGAIEKAISMAIREQNLQLWPSQVEKVKQLYSQIMVRHGVIQVGPTGGGKTTVRNLLQRALVLLPTLSENEDDDKNNVSHKTRRQSVYYHNRAKKAHVEVFTINPKCVKLGELYGETDSNTFEWTDGLISSATRRFANKSSNEESTKPTINKPDSDDQSEIDSFVANSAGRRSSIINQGSRGSISITRRGSEVTSSATGQSLIQQMALMEGNVDAMPTDWKWLVLDGPVDTIWVENLNTALDDSKILCLANGERITIPNEMRVMFEVDNLSQASPATISRCAMVYMDPIDLGWKPYVNSWLTHLPKDLPEVGKKHLSLLFNHSIDKGLEFLKKFKKYLCIPAPDLSIISTLCHILSSYIEFMKNHGGYGSDDTVENVVDGRPSNKSIRGTVKSGMRKYDEHETKQKEFYLNRNPGNLTIVLGKLFVFAFTWSFGGNLKRQDEAEDEISLYTTKNKNEIDIGSDFDTFVRELFDVEPPIGVRLPASIKTMYSYFIDLDTGNFILWDSLVPATSQLIERGFNLNENTVGEIVPTIDSVRHSFLISLLLVEKHCVLITGDSGVGKTALVHYTLNQLSKDNGTTYKSGSLLGNVFNFTERNQALLENINFLTKMGNDDNDSSLEMMFNNRSKSQTQLGILSSFLQLSAQTSSNRMQQAILQKLIKRNRDMVAPKGRKVVVFIDDLNMPALEQYGAQPPLELLRQFIDMNGFYDSKKLVWKDVMDVTLVSACAPPGGGRNPISQRLLKHFSIFALPTPSTKSLQHIFQVQLGIFFNENDFLSEVKDCLFSLVSAAIGIYYRTSYNMKPTPSKSHYTFNIRDLAGVVKGLYNADRNTVVNSDQCALLFAHEATRIFHDRLIDSDDRKLYFTMLSDNLHDFFKVKWPAEKLQEDPILFTDFNDSAIKGSLKVYRSVTDKNKLRITLEELYMRHSFGSANHQQIVFFNEALEHILRAMRVFRSPGGHMLLVGLDGTGKSTTIKLASFISNAELFTLNLSRHYSNVEFREDLKKVYKLAGVQGTNTIFLLTDSEIVDESFLEDINCILNSGEVPDLFDNEEIDSVLMELKTAATEANVTDTREALTAFFIKRFRANMHVVLAMSPAGSKFRQRTRMNPSLISCCTIDWFDEWSTEGMLDVAHAYIENANLIDSHDTDIDQLKQSIGNCCVEIHKSVKTVIPKYFEECRRKFYVTPSTYMELIRLYERMLRDQKHELCGDRDRLLNGLNKLSEANQLVGSMQEELVLLGPKIDEAAKDTEILLEQLKKDQAAVDQVREIVEAEEAVMQKETNVVQQYADECQYDLVSVLPLLESALSALNSLDKTDISEVRVYTNPPELVIIVMSAVCVLLGEKTDWSTSKKIIGDSNFLNRLLNFDRDSIGESIFQRMKRFTGHPNFTPEKVGIVSKACKSLCMWILALQRYYEVHKMAKPKQKKCEEAREALEMARKNLSRKQASLAKITEHLNRLNQQYENSVSQRDELQRRKVLTGVRLQRASVLITALSDEKDRWLDSVASLENRLKSIVGDILISASSVAYLGVFDTKFRNDLIGQWIAILQTANIPLSSSYSLVKNLVSENQILVWQNQGIPLDMHSTENAVIMSKGRKWPLLIDPQGQAFKWICKKEKNELKVLHPADSNYMRSIERALRTGEAILLQNVNEVLDPSLTPILSRNTYLRGANKVIKIGDSEIEYNDNFRLYLTTSMNNPHFLPAVCNNVNIIDFTVTFNGLQEQLLSNVVRQEKPNLEEDRKQLLESIANDLLTLRNLEDKTLRLLQDSKGHILDDEDLIETLEKSKIKSKEVSQRLIKSEETAKNLNKARHEYLPVATRGSVIYFVLASLSNVDIMYQFSLDWFQKIFSASIVNPVVKDSKPRRSFMEPVAGRMRPSSSSSLNKDYDDENTIDLVSRMYSMIERLTWNVYKIVCVGLFAQHQLTFSFTLCSSIMRSNEKMWQKLNEENIDKNKYAKLLSMGYVTDEQWNILMRVTILAKLMTDMEKTNLDGLTSIERLEVENTKKQPIKYENINRDKWLDCQYLEKNFESFSFLLRSLITCHEQWDGFFTCDEPYEYVSRPFDRRKMSESQLESSTIFCWEKLTRFERLILIRVLRPSLLTISIRTFVCQQMGSKFLSSGSINLRSMFNESDAKTPLIFILSSGSDPTAQLLRFAKEMRGSTLHVDMISLGRGQGPKAEELLHKAQILKGRWVFLQNCHLAASWMPKLQSIVDGFNQSATETDPNFRLWLSSKPDLSFPISILQTGLKITVEAAVGVRSHVQRVLNGGAINERQYEEKLGVDNGKSWKTLLFSLCLFNAALHERRKYDTLGWNISYEFNDSDLEVSVLQLHQLLTDSPNEIPWKALKFLTGQVTFGGRVTDDWDRRCLSHLVDKFYNKSIFEAGYTLSSDGLYKLPPSNFSFSDIKAYVENLPVIDSPDLVGMNNEAQIAYLENQTTNILNTIVLMQPRQGVGSQVKNWTGDEYIFNIVDEILRTLPERVDDNFSNENKLLNLNEILQIANGTYLKGKSKKEVLTKRDKDIATLETAYPQQIRQLTKLTNSALFTVLRQEMERFDKLLSVIHKSLRSLKKAIQGEIVMSESLEDAYTCLLNQKIPTKWHQFSYESCKKLSSWISDLNNRVEFIRKWSDTLVSEVERVLKVPISFQKTGKHQANDTLELQELDLLVTQPKSFWLSAFFFPQGFLTAVLQNHARKLLISIDSLTFDFIISDNILDENELKSSESLKVVNEAFEGQKPPEDGVLVFGLFIDGARWSLDMHCLDEVVSGNRISRLPEIHFKPVIISEQQQSNKDTKSASSNRSQRLRSAKRKTIEKVNYSYDCPLYRTSARAGALSSTGHSTNFVMSIQLPSTHEEQHWILRGVALLTQLDE